MAGWTDLSNLWNTFKELDIRPLRDDAERAISLAIVGVVDAGKSTLIHALRHGARTRERVIIPAIEAYLAEKERIASVDLIVLVVDATRDDFSLEVTPVREWVAAGRSVLVFYNKMDALRDANSIGASLALWQNARVAFGSALDPQSLENDFIPRVLDALPDRHPALARRFPLFRETVARELIGETCRANALYALGTGLAETIPVLDIPFNVADIMILTKNQALMAYKLGLALGLSTRWQDHVAELGGAIGSGFLWRQIARQLVGLIPVWGIIPKVAVAYAGTFAVGEAILYWYKTGKKISGRGMRELYGRALARGKQMAQELVARTPKLPMLR